MSITCCITCSRIHYMLPIPLHDPEFITCPRIHYMLPKPLHAPEFITCSRIHYMALHSTESITCISCHYMAFTCHLSMFLVFRALRRQGLPSLDHHQYLRPTLTQPAQRTRPAASTIAFPPLRYVFNAVLSASRLDE